MGTAGTTFPFSPGVGLHFGIGTTFPGGKIVGINIAARGGAGFFTDFG